MTGGLFGSVLGSVGGSGGSDGGEESESVSFSGMTKLGTPQWVKATDVKMKKSANNLNWFFNGIPDNELFSFGNRFSNEYFIFL